MKAYTRAAVPIAALLILTACGTEEDTAPDAKSRKKPAAAKDRLRVDRDLGEPGKVAVGAVTITGLKPGTETEGYAEPVPYLRYKLAFHNTSSKAVDLVDVASNCYGPDGKATAGIDAAGTDPVDSRHVEPGATVGEVRACRLPKSAPVVTIQVVAAGDEVTFGGSVPR